MFSKTVLRRALAVSTLAFFFSLIPAYAQDIRARTDDEGTVTHLFELEHMSTKAVIRALRSILEIRRVSEHSMTRQVVIRDTPQRVDAAVELIEKLDIETPTWHASLVAETPNGPNVVQTLVLSDAAEFEASVRGSGSLKVQLALKRATKDEITVTYDCAVGFGRITSASVKHESRRDFADGDSLELISTMTKDRAQVLGEILGLPSDATSVKLMFERVR